MEISALELNFELAEKQEIDLNRIKYLKTGLI